jgi:preprotein translocase subunit SecD
LSSEKPWNVFARISIAGSKALSEATATHVGRYLAIMIGDDLVDTPRIDTKLTTSFIQLRGYTSRAVADSLLTRAFRAIDASCVARIGRGGTVD